MVNSAWRAVLFVSILFLFSSCAPDLKVRATSHEPVCPQAKEKVTFKVIVENAGEKKAGKSELSFQIGDEKNPVIFPIPELKPKQTYTVTREKVFDIDHAYTNRVLLDIKNEVEESDKSNNESIEQYGVGVLCWRAILR